MRLVQVTVPSGEREAVLGALDDEEIDYVVTEESSGRDYEALVSFPLPAEAVEPVLEHLRTAGLDADAYTVVLDAETVISRRADELVERYQEERDEDRIARQELHARAEDLIPSRSSYLLMNGLSGMIATAGLLLDSPAVVVGSMVIAPLIGPALSTAVGTVLDDRDMFATGVRYQLSGFTTVIALSAIFAFVVKTGFLVPPGLDVLQHAEVQERVMPDFLALAVALGAGVAGAVSLRSGVSTSLVGVMIAVALVPPAATVGIGIAWELPAVALGAAVLCLVNGLSINLAALGTFWHSGYRPEQWFRQDAARSRTIKRAATLVVTIAILCVVLGGVTVASYQAATFEQEVRGTATDLFDEEPYDDLELIGLDVTYEDPVPLPTRHAHVTIVVGQQTGTPPPDLAETLGTRLTGAWSGPVGVEVQYVTIDRHPAPDAASQPTLDPTSWLTANIPTTGEAAT